MTYDEPEVWGIGFIIGILLTAIFFLWLSLGWV